MMKRRTEGKEQRANMDEEVELKERNSDGQVDVWKPNMKIKATFKSPVV